MLDVADGEQRAHFAHEHPNDFDSSSSSPSSSTPTYVNSGFRSKSASHQRSHTTTDGSRSSHLLARLVSLEEVVREINAATVVTTERLEAETSRADAAERRALDYFHRLRVSTENREHAEQESMKLHEELKLCKLQLENVQKELLRVTAQRNEAEAKAARARTKAGKLQEEMLAVLARKDGHRMECQEELSRGCRIGYDEGSGRRLTVPSDRLPHLPLSLAHHDGDETMPELGKDEEHNEPRSHVQLHPAASTRQQPMRSESAPPVRTLETSLHPPPLPVPPRVPTLSHEHYTPFLPRDLDELRTIHPIPINPSPIICSQPTNVPIDDRWIPGAGSRPPHIKPLPLHELQQPTPPSTSSVATEVRDSRATQQSEETPLSPPVRLRDYAYQTPVLPPISRGHSPSIASHTLTHLWKYDIMNKRPGSALQNESYVGRARPGNKHSRESTSRNEHHDQEHPHSTEAENTAEQWRADDDASPLWNPPRLLTPSVVPHTDDPRPRRFIPTESAAVLVCSLPPLDVHVSPHARTQLESVTPSPFGDVDNPRHSRQLRPVGPRRGRAKGATRSELRVVNQDETRESAG
ncbi:hypothetical protein OG21DRAFT_1491612 [Imleria badia]|nr:hypothetical protein OG21DRAFT_1491612 [Imleria badia]